MPLPDATPDQRIYKLLKTTDLENLTFSDFQKVAQTIYAEQGAEDELRRIVLVNLARLSVAGEWTGLTSAGGGGETGLATPLVPSEWNDASVSYLGTSRSYNVSSSTTGMTTGTNPKYFRFTSPLTGNLASMKTEITAGTTAGQTVRIGVYNADATGRPSTLIGYADIDAASTGQKTQTSFSATITLEQNKMYWIGYVKTDSGSTPEMRSITNNSANGPPNLGIGTSLSGFARYSAYIYPGDSSLDLTADLSSIIANIYISSDVYPIIGVTYS